VDVGCGSLVFTAEAYAQKRDQLIVVVDMSIAMLRRARDRLRRIRGKVPDNIVLLQADATRLPFTSQSFSRTLSWGVLHVMSDRDAFIDELNRVTRYDGAITLSSLVIDRPFGHRYLKILERTGEVSGLLSSSEVQRLFARHGLVARTTVQGNMAFLTSP
jgi:ubiquinone/menaquinone biosynthesis C-methylase UbiE